jgi:TRAP-type C4-dicarboxylate transport system substrate-binding protein
MWLPGISAFMPVLMLVFSCVAAPDNARAATEIRVSIAPPQDSLIYEAVKVFKEEAERLSAGSLHIEIFHSAKLYKTNETPKAVQSGAVEAGAAWLSLYMDTIPAASIFSIPFMFSRQKMAAAAAAPENGIRGPIDEAIPLARNVRVLFWAPFPAVTFASKGFAISSPETIAGRKVRVFGALLPEFVKLCGGKPVPLTGTDVPAAFRDGRIEATITALDVFTSLKLWEVADHVNVARPIHDEWVLVMNGGFWDSLNPDAQRILKEAGRVAEKVAREKVSQWEEETVKLITSHGVTVTTISDDDIMAWKSCSSEIAENYLSKSDRLGMKVMNAYRKLLISIYSTPSK